MISIVHMQSIRIPKEDQEHNPDFYKRKTILELLPRVDLHRALLLQVLMHLERLEEQVRLMAHALLQTLKLGTVEVVL